MIYKTRNRTSLKNIIYALHLHFNGLSLRNTATALPRFVHRSLIQQYETGFKSINQRDCFTGKQILMNLLLMKHK